MVDVSGIDWNWGVSIAWYLIPLAVLGVITLMAFAGDAYSVGDTFGFISALWLVFGGVIILLFVPMMGVDAQERDLVVEQLREQGYEDVTLEWDDGFSASVDGQYFKGLLHYLGDKKYQVVEVPRG